MQPRRASHPAVDLLTAIVAILMLVVAVDAVKCFDCRSDQGSCNDGECAGSICIKIETSSRRNGKVSAAIVFLFCLYVKSLSFYPDTQG
jgi:hypothetical protein